MNRTTHKIFKFIYKNPVGISTKTLYNVFPNKTIVDEICSNLIEDKFFIKNGEFIELTARGYDYYYEKRKNFILNIFRILINPILVAVISSFITARIVSSNNNCNCDITCNYSNDNLNQGK